MSLLLQACYNGANQSGGKMEVSINYLAVLFGAIASMVVGSIWYMPAVLGKTWQRLIGLNEKDLKEKAVSAMIKAFAMAILTAYILAHITYLSYHFFGNSWMSASLGTAFWTWLGFVFTSHITNDAFEQRDIRLTGLTIGHHLLEFMAMGLVIGLMGV